MSVCRGGALLILGENTASYAQHSNSSLRRSHGVWDLYAHLELAVHISKGPGLCSSPRTGRRLIPRRGNDAVEETCLQTRVAFLAIKKSEEGCFHST